MRALRVHRSVCTAFTRTSGTRPVSGQGPAIAALKDNGNEGSPVTCTTVDVDAVAEMGGMIEGGVAVNDEPFKVVVGF